MHENFKFDFSQFCLNLQSKYNLLIMQLRLNPRSNRSLVKRNLIIKTVLFALIFILVIFLLDKIEMPTPNKNIKKEIGNEKLITVK